MVSHRLAHYRIGVCTRPTLIGAKHLNSAQTDSPIIMQGSRIAREMKPF